ncbi:hypothetical protein PanWU01x14_162900 [Parasponia andersonii]|uniref:Uncharacterized protein n=1 Tax=Parasponia andersonii TaxID=3476 RepID=A0A2P5CD95_PARAD|nr:hypothetical protein PanWU01x14_162900 [Parasponia andersonii]
MQTSGRQALLQEEKTLSWFSPGSKPWYRRGNPRQPSDATWTTTIYPSVVLSWEKETLFFSFSKTSSDFCWCPFFPFNVHPVHLRRKVQNYAEQTQLVT